MNQTDFCMLLHPYLLLQENTSLCLNNFLFESSAEKSSEFWQADDDDEDVTGALVWQTKRIKAF